MKRFNKIMIVMLLVAVLITAFPVEIFASVKTPQNIPFNCCTVRVTATHTYRYYGNTPLSQDLTHVWGSYSEMWVNGSYGGGYGTINFPINELLGYASTDSELYNLENPSLIGEIISSVVSISGNIVQLIENQINNRVSLLKQLADAIWGQDTWIGFDMDHLFVDLKIPTIDQGKKLAMGVNINELEGHGIDIIEKSYNKLRDGEFEDGWEEVSDTFKPVGGGVPNYWNEKWIDLYVEPVPNQNLQYSCYWVYSNQVYTNTVTATESNGEITIPAEVPEELKPTKSGVYKVSTYPVNDPVIANYGSCANGVAPSSGLTGSGGIGSQSGLIVKATPNEIALVGSVVEQDPNVDNPVKPTLPSAGKPVKPEGSINPIDWIVYIVEFIGWLIGSLIGGIVSIIISLVEGLLSIINSFDGVIAFFGKILSFLPKPIVDVMTVAVTITLVWTILKMVRGAK